MSRDTDLVGTLRQLDRAQYPGRGERLDPGLVVRAGRRRVRNRRLAAGVASGALVLALAFGVPAALSGRATSHPPAGQDAAQAPRPVGTGRIAVLTDDIAAVNLPAGEGTTELTVDDILGWHVRFSPAAGGSAGVDVSWEREAGAPGWDTPPDPFRRTISGAPDSAPVGGWASGEAAGDAVYVVAGAVPVGLRGPIALLTSEAAFDLGDAGKTLTVEVPTFEAFDGRLLYAVALRGDSARQFAAQGWQMTFVGAGGEAVVPGCEDHDLATCAIERLPYDRVAAGEVPIQRFAPVEPAPDATGADGPVTVLPAYGLPDPVEAGLVGPVEALEPVDGVNAHVLGGGDGSVLPVAVTPTTPPDGSDYFPAHRSGFGLWTPGGGIEWITPPPSAPQRGAETVEATVSSEWVAWFESDYDNWLDTPYVLWAKPRSGGDAREIARSQEAPEGVLQHAIYDHRPVIVGDRLFWYDEVYEDGSTAAVMLSAPLDGSQPARVEMRGVTTLMQDRCGDEAVLSVLASSADGSAQELHRLTIGGSGAVESDDRAEDLLRSASDPRALAVCGSTSAVARDIDPEAADRGTLLQVDHAGERRTFEWPKGTGSSLRDLTIAHGLVTWSMVNGTDDGGAYVLDLATGTLHRFAGSASPATDGTFVWWTVDDSGTPQVVAARLPGG